MEEIITSLVGLDVHKDSVAIAVAEAGRQAPRFIGTVVPRLSSLHKVLRDIRRASRTLVVYGKRGATGSFKFFFSTRINRDTIEFVVLARVAN
jgi:transposase